MLVVAGGLIGGYYVLGTRSVANAANPPAEPVAKAPTNPKDALSREVEVKTASGTTRMTWSELGAEVDPEETSSLRVDRDKAIKALFALKAKTDKAPQNAYLDLEQRVVHEDRAGQGLDVWGSLPRIAAAARTNAAKIELSTIVMPSAISKASLGIDDISHVLGFYTTHFPVSDQLRNFNLKLAASKINGVVLKPGVEWSFNGQVGERSEKEGYKIAHVITAGEMVDGLAGGTCQISTTLFGAAFFAGLDIVKTTNHSRPSAYTPLGFDATVVWPNTDLKLKNPYDFPVVLRYVVANGEAVVEVLGPKERPWSKITFERHIFERTPFLTEERLDNEIANDETSVDQDGFDGIKLMRFRRFYDKDGKLDHSNKWDVTYPPVTMYIRRGTNPDPDAKHAVQKENHALVAPKGDSMAMDITTKELQAYEQRLKTKP